MEDNELFKNIGFLSNDIVKKVNFLLHKVNELEKEIDKLKKEIWTNDKK